MVWRKKQSKKPRGTVPLTCFVTRKVQGSRDKQYMYSCDYYFSMAIRTICMKKKFLCDNKSTLFMVHTVESPKVCSALSSGQVASGRKILVFRFRNRGTYFWFILSACFFHFASDVFSYHKCWPSTFRTHITVIHMYITSYKGTFHPSTIY